MYRKVHVRKNEETVSDKMFPPTNENNVIEYERYNNARIKIYSTLKTFTSSGTLFSAVFFSVKIGRNFSRGENSRGNSKRFENSVGNCRKRGLIKTIRGRRARFSALFPYLRTGRTLSVDRACCAKRKWKHWHGGGETRK